MSVTALIYNFVLKTFFCFNRGVNYITWEHNEKLYQEDEVSNMPHWFL